LRPVFRQNGKFIEIDYTISVQVHPGRSVTIVHQPKTQKDGKVVHFYYVVAREIAVKAAEYLVRVARLN
jgi:hypothetical protein